MNAIIAIYSILSPGVLLLLLVSMMLPKSIVSVDRSMGLIFVVGPAISMAIFGVLVSFYGGLGVLAYIFGSVICALLVKAIVDDMLRP